jgi:chemotaxis methyl-accepting protein methylase
MKGLFRHRRPANARFFFRAPLFFFFLVIPVLPAVPAGASTLKTVFRGDETRFEIRYRDARYHLANLIGEAKYYQPHYYDDKILFIEDRPALSFTMIADEVVDFYYYVSHPGDIRFLIRFIEERRLEFQPYTRELLDSLSRYLRTKTEYSREALYTRVAELIKQDRRITLLIGKGEVSRRDRLNGILYNYLRSNGITGLNEIRNRPALIRMLINKFYMLGTTCFFRNWAFIEPFKDRLKPLVRRAERRARPLKIKVFGCSTGEEAMSFALELLELGIENFTVLASDINEASLDYARKMSYPMDAFERLPLVHLKKIRKHYRFNDFYKTWELKDPGFFKSRIRFINHNILDPLPADLDPRFAPPFDLVSIHNVLIYLEPDAARSRKDQWKNLLREGGILVLRDSQHSLAKGTFGKEWSFNNFQIDNEWINVRNRALSPRQKVALYETRFRAEPTDLNYQLLVRGYQLTGKHQKINEATDVLLKNNPFSFQGIASRISYYASLGNMARLNETVEKMGYYSSDIQGVYPLLATLYRNMASHSFFRELGERYALFLNNYKEKPGEIANLFGGERLASRQWGILREIVEANCLNLLIGLYEREGDREQVVRLAYRNLKQVARLARSRPEYLIVAKLLNRLAKMLVPYYLENQSAGKALSFCDEALSILKFFDRDIPYFYMHDLTGYLNQQKFLLQKDSAPAREKKLLLRKSVAGYQKALPLLNHLPPLRRSGLLEDAGLSRMLSGRLKRDAGQEEPATQDFLSALHLFEKSLQINPLYGNRVAQYRNRLIEISEAIRNIYAPYTVFFPSLNIPSSDSDVP